MGLFRSATNLQGFTSSVRIVWWQGGCVSLLTLWVRVGWYKKSELLFFFFFFGLLLGPYLQHMEVPRLGVESELQLPAYTIATAISDPSHVCDLHHTPQQHQILNSLSEARDRTCNLIVPSGICFCCAMIGTPCFKEFYTAGLMIKSLIHLKLFLNFKNNFIGILLIFSSSFIEI